MMIDMIIRDISPTLKAYLRPKSREIELKAARMLCTSPHTDPAPGWEKEEEEEW